MINFADHQYRIQWDPDSKPRSVEATIEHEWLATNDLGGFACGTVLGPNTRRYHGLLVASMDPPVDRFVLVNHVAEVVETSEETITLDTNIYPGAVHPEGFRHLETFRRFPYPRWEYSVGDATLARELTTVHGENTTCVRWTVDQRGEDLDLTVRPKLSGRGYHHLQHFNDTVVRSTRHKNGICEWSPYDDAPNFFGFHNGSFREAPDWFYQVRYPLEARRGLDHQEDWWSPGPIQFEVTPESPARLIFSTNNYGKHIEDWEKDAFQRRKERYNEHHKKRSDQSRLRVRLEWATDDFNVCRGDGRTLLAGYPWFTDWGRDTFIALTGLCLVPGQYDMARSVLETFAGHIDRGMIPNRFPDEGGEPEYNTIDASLWFIHAVGKYLEYCEDEAFAREVGWPAVRSIIEGYNQGTRYEIQRMPDGLIHGGTPETQLTWMDAETHEGPVTPRDGKPVEIQALWIRALNVAQGLANRTEHYDELDRYIKWQERAIDTFRDRFWYEEGGYLYDVIDGHAGDDYRLRPNQLYAVSLVDEIVPDEWAADILESIEQHLLTPRGLRTLDPRHDDYEGDYKGSPDQRDGCYHQGTAWMFLLGTYLSAHSRVHGSGETVDSRVSNVLQGISEHLGEACVGSASEIFDGDSPHHARGCFAQAWSVAEPLRAIHEDLDLQQDRRGLKLNAESPDSGRKKT